MAELDSDDSSTVQFELKDGKIDHTFAYFMFLCHK